MDKKKPSRSIIKRIFRWFKKHYLPLVGLLATLAIIAIVSIIYIKNPNIFKELEAYGYTGVFVISVFLNATIILPVSNMTVIMAMGATLPSPLIVGSGGGNRGWYRRNDGISGGAQRSRFIVQDQHV